MLKQTLVVTHNLHVLMCSTHSVVIFEFPSVFITFADRVERTVVACLAIPEAVVIVRHNVNHIQVIQYSWEVVSLVDD